MIYTVTLNPAVDQTIFIKDFEIDQVNRVSETREDAGGKGINVSKMIKNLNGESVAMGIVGGSKGLFIESQLKRLGIETFFVQRPTNTRTNIKIVDLLKQTFTDINESGGELENSILETFETQIFKKVKASDILVLAGSVPAGVPKDIYGQWIEKAKEKKIKTFLDADGELLEEGIKKGPYLVKPNIAELERLCGKSIEDEATCVQLAKEFLTYGVEYLVISMGEKGSLVVSSNRTIKIPALKVPVKSTVGAGDAMVGALAYGLDQGQSIEEAITLGVAASSASIQLEGTEMGNYNEVVSLLNEIVLQEIGA